jgi:hypothetical protein
LSPRCASDVHGMATRVGTVLARSSAHACHRLLIATAFAIDSRMSLLTCTPADPSRRAEAASRLRIGVVVAALVTLC